MFVVSFIPAFKDNYIWLLTEGKRLARLHYRLTPEEQRILLSLAEQQLHCQELVISPLPSSMAKSWK